MNFFEKEMRSLFEANNVLTDMKFTGKMMIGKLDDQKLCKLQFVTTDTVKKYPAICATIINSNEGVVDKQNFKFSDIIGMYQRGIGDEVEPHIWDYRDKPSWYTPVTPTQKAEITDSILDYVEMFQDQTYGLAMQFK